MSMHSSLRRFVPAAFLFTLVTFSTNAPMARQSAFAQDAFNCSLQLCYRSPRYLLNNYKRLRFFPRDIFISGVNLNHPVDCVDNPGPILFALRANALNYTFSPLALFNQQYVAAQLTHALALLCDVTGIAAISEERDADMTALGKILQMLNTCQ